MPLFLKNAGWVNRSVTNFDETNQQRYPGRIRRSTYLRLRQLLHAIMNLFRRTCQGGSQIKIAHAVSQDTAIDTDSRLQRGFPWVAPNDATSARCSADMPFVPPDSCRKCFHLCRHFDTHFGWFSNVPNFHRRRFIRAAGTLSLSQLFPLSLTNRPNSQNAFPSYATGLQT
jgi:hypothetical protein